MTRTEQILTLRSLLLKHRFELDVTAGIEMNHGADGEPFASIPPHLYDKYDASIRYATIEDLKLDVTDKGVTLSLPVLVCDCCGQKVESLHTVKISGFIDNLCDGCLDNEVGPR